MFLRNNFGYNQEILDTIRKFSLMSEIILHLRTTLYLPIVFYKPNLSSFIMIIRNKYLDHVRTPQIIPQPARGCHRDLFFRSVIHETRMLIVAIYILDSVERSVWWIWDEIFWREREIDFHAWITRRRSGRVRSRSDAVSIIPEEYSRRICYVIFYFTIFCG